MLEKRCWVPTFADANLKLTVDLLPDLLSSLPLFCQEGSAILPAYVSCNPRVTILVTAQPFFHISILGGQEITSILRLLQRTLHTLQMGQNMILFVE
jgi:hypothetical protein